MFTNLIMLSFHKVCAWEIIILYILKTCNFIFQLYINEAGGRKGGESTIGRTMA